MAGRPEGVAARGAPAPFANRGGWRFTRSDPLSPTATSPPQGGRSAPIRPKDASPNGRPSRYEAIAEGQQAPVVFFSMATSTGADLPRGLEFLFSPNRINVAISRAQCLAYVVGSPMLLVADARSPEQMRLVNTVCRLAELGSE